MFYKENNPKSILEKYTEFMAKDSNKQVRGEYVKLDKPLPKGTHIGNPSAPFYYDGKKVICIRICTASEEDDKSIFYYEDGDVFRQFTPAREFELQDPYIAHINGEYVFGGVKGWKVDKDKWTWLCEFYNGKTLENFSHLLSGPTLMKDIRLCETVEKKVGVFTRPQGILYRKKSGRLADIGYVEADSIYDLDTKMMMNADNLKGIFRADEWGGVNQVYKLKNGLLGILGHMAYGEGEFREGLVIHYYGMAFVFNPKTREFTDPKIIVTRDNFPLVSDGSPRCVDVIFSGGLDRLGGGKAVFYGGVSDCRVGKMEIEDPFSEFENLKI